MKNLFRNQNDPDRDEHDELKKIIKNEIFLLSSLIGIGPCSVNRRVHRSFVLNFIFPNVLLPHPSEFMNEWVVAV